jgi:NAD(P)-dependent dehydrogenase (short-subunit alcohol dehydrogenase family)
MTKNLYILTGASRGMGRAMAEQLLGPDHHLLCISRHTNDALTAKATDLNCSLEQWPLDLEDGLTAGARLARWLESRSASEFHSATLINNAGVIPDIAPLSATNPVQLVRALRVGLEAPMLMTAAFLSATEHWAVPRKVLNVSSGLGRRAMASQTAYCAAKAGMDHFTRCLALEEALKPQGAKVCSLAPGVIDTDMQVQLRSASATAFPDQNSFLSLHNNGQLSSPADAAAQVLARLARADFGNQPVDDVRS